MTCEQREARARRLRLALVPHRINHDYSETKATNSAGSQACPNIHPWRNVGSEARQKCRIDHDHRPIYRASTFLEVVNDQRYQGDEGGKPRRNVRVRLEPIHRINTNLFGQVIPRPLSFSRAFPILQVKSAREEWWSPLFPRQKRGTDQLVSAMPELCLFAAHGMLLSLSECF